MTTLFSYPQSKEHSVPVLSRLYYHFGRLARALSPKASSKHLRLHQNSQTLTKASSSPQSRHSTKKHLVRGPSLIVDRLRARFELCSARPRLPPRLSRTNISPRSNPPRTYNRGDIEMSIVPYAFRVRFASLIAIPERTARHR